MARDKSQDTVKALRQNGPPSPPERDIEDCVCQSEGQGEDGSAQLCQPVEVRSYVAKFESWCISQPTRVQLIQNLLEIFIVRY